MIYPDWIKIKKFDRQRYLDTLKLINDNHLNTICLAGNCPNRYECFSKKTATFMILGDRCTRNCLYCNVKKGKPNSVDKEEPKRIAEAVKKLNLNYVVITCVTRDDLKDGGASQFVKVVKEIKKVNSFCKIELLISDLDGNYQALKKIIDQKPDIINHNIEVVRDLFPILRPKGDYERSLELLKKIKVIDSQIKTKSGFMLGFGENEQQIKATLKDLKNNDCDIVTIGQYLQPSSLHFKIKKYYTPEEFKKIEIMGKKIGIKKMIVGPLVRSSYKAHIYN